MANFSGIATTMNRSYLELIWLRGTGALKADAQQSYLGMIWWILEPLLLSALFYLAFSTGLRGTEGGNFAFFLLCGMLPFKWTAACLTGSSNALIANKGLFGQMYLPKWIFPATVNLSMALRFMIVVALLVGIMIYGGYGPQWSWLSLVYVVLCQLVFNLGIGYLAAALVPLIPDLIHVVPLLVMALMFTSGIFFDIADRPPEIQEILHLNPFVEILDSYRAVLMHGEVLSPFDTLYAWSFGIGCLLLGYFLLKKLDRYYPRALP